MSSQSDMIKELAQERAAELAARELGAAIHSACRSISQQGGDTPFDGVMSIAYDEILRLEGWQADPNYFGSIDVMTRRRRP